MNREFDFNMETPTTRKDPLEGFEKVANGFSAHSEKKITNQRENDKESVSFQQDMIEYLLSICENKEDVKNFWGEYGKSVSVYIKEIDGDKNKEEAWTYFNNLKRSIIGSSAVVRFFEGQGFQMRFPSVEEDITKKCDLKFDKGGKITLAVQIKSSYLNYLDKKEEGEVINRLVLTNTGADVKKLKEDKDRKDFRTLSSYCSLSSGNNKIYLPVFVNIPVTKESVIRRRVVKTNLVDESGKINETLQKAMEVKWGEAKENFGVDLNKY